MSDWATPLRLLYQPWFFFIWGACWGSFLNVVMYRYPLGISVVNPPSACPNCKAPIAFYDNIPALSWLILRGKCRRCKASFSPMYAVNEALFGLIFAGAVWLHADRWPLGLSLGTGLLAVIPAAVLWIRVKRAPWYLNATALGCGAFYASQVVF